MTYNTDKIVTLFVDKSTGTWGEADDIVFVAVPIEATYKLAESSNSVIIEFANEWGWKP